MSIIYTCPKCGSDLEETVLATNPPQYRKLCRKCGYEYIEKTETIRIPFAEPEVDQANLITQIDNNPKVEYNPKMPIIVQSIHTLYSLPGCSCGGCCHIVTDDDNIRDENLQFVIDYCNRPENADCVDKELSELICKLLLQLSFEQRCVLFYMFLSDYFVNNDLDESTWDIFINYISDKTVQEMVEEFTYF